MNRARSCALGASALILAAVAGCASAPPPQGASVAHPDAAAALAAAVADPGRAAADTARDLNRKPAEIMAFAGVRPGMVIGELAPGRGYYTRLLSQAVGPGGKVYALVSRAQAARPGGLDALNAVAAQHPNVVVTPIDYTGFSLPQKADLFWTTENYHDFHNGPTADAAAVDRAVLSNLKPGGVFFVEDHRAKPGSGPAATSTLHRIEEAQTRSELLAAGFRFDAASDLLHNPADPGDTRNSDSAVTGRTDRFALRFKAPG